MRDESHLHVLHWSCSIVLDITFPSQAFHSGTYVERIISFHCPELWTATPLQLNLHQRLRCSLTIIRRWEAYKIEKHTTKNPCFVNPGHGYCKISAVDGGRPRVCVETYFSRYILNLVRNFNFICWLHVDYFTDYCCAARHWHFRITTYNHLPNAVILKHWIGESGVKNSMTKSWKKSCCCCFWGFIDSFDRPPSDVNRYWLSDIKYPCSFKCFEIYSEFTDTTRYLACPLHNAVALHEFVTPKRKISFFDRFHRLRLLRWYLVWSSSFFLRA